MMKKGYKTTKVIKGKELADIIENSSSTKVEFNDNQYCPFAFPKRTMKGKDSETTQTRFYYSVYQGVPKFHLRDWVFKKDTWLASKGTVLAADQVLQLMDQLEKLRPALINELNEKNGFIKSELSRIEKENFYSQPFPTIDEIPDDSDVNSFEDIMNEFNSKSMGKIKIKS
tara:strand:- start:118 stop:630 length:513 start_codon:yes stop_codon:yes gene_type:complete